MESQLIHRNQEPSGQALRHFLEKGTVSVGRKFESRCSYVRRLRPQHDSRVPAQVDAPTFNLGIPFNNLKRNVFDRSIRADNSLGRKVMKL